MVNDNPGARSEGLLGMVLLGDEGFWSGEKASFRCTCTVLDSIVCSRTLVERK